MRYDDEQYRKLNDAVNAANGQRRLSTVDLLLEESSPEVNVQRRTEYGIWTESGRV